jgi:hypothetical protein
LIDNAVILARSDADVVAVFLGLQFLEALRVRIFLEAEKIAINLFTDVRIKTP